MLQQLRTQRGVTMTCVAQRLGVPVADVKALEHTPFERLKLDVVERFAEALGFRLHVGVVHRSSGDTAWLRDSDIGDDDDLVIAS